ALGGDDVRGLVRVEAEDGPSPQGGRALLDDAHVEVSVLHGPGEVALLKRRPHHVVLTAGHLAPEHDRLRTPADTGAHCAYKYVVGAGVGQYGRADLTDSGSADPEGARID